MSSRYEKANILLENNEFTKLVCGAGNQNLDEIRHLSMVYTRAGISAIDVSATRQSVMAALKGIADAGCGESPFIIVSVGMQGDMHVRKAKILTSMCEYCGNCVKVCDQSAIIRTNTTGGSIFTVDNSLCIGCGRCGEVCEWNAIVYESDAEILKDTLLACRNVGAEMCELHASVPYGISIWEEWGIINEVFPDNFVSLCLDRSWLGNNHLISRINNVRAASGTRLIIQADGIPMSGLQDDYNTTLQAVATADIIRKSGFRGKLIVSGGTNSLTKKLADMCGVSVNGVAIGTFARKVASSIPDARYLVKSCGGK